MFTRCPGCQAVYELSAPILSEASGVVRCGNCGKTFNTLSHLFADHPDETAEPIRGGGMPPLLEHPERIQAELPVSFEAVDEPDRTGDGAADDGPLQPLPATTGGNAPSFVWPLATASLLVLLFAQTWLLWQTPGSPLPRWAGADSTVHTINPNEAIQIVSRDLHRHPSLDDAVILSATLRNTEQFSMAYPVLEVRFYDASQQLLGARRLEPEQYLRDVSRLDSGMSPGTIVPLVMEFVVGSTEPTGFHIRFF